MLQIKYTVIAVKWLIYIYSKLKPCLAKTNLQNNSHPPPDIKHNSDNANYIIRIQIFREASHVCTHTHGKWSKPEPTVLLSRNWNNQHGANDTSSPGNKLEPAFISVSTSGTDGAAAGVLQCLLNMQRDSTLQLDCTQATKTSAAEDMPGISPE